MHWTIGEWGGLVNSLVRIHSFWYRFGSELSWMPTCLILWSQLRWRKCHKSELLNADAQCFFSSTFKYDSRRPFEQGWTWLYALRMLYCLKISGILHPILSDLIISISSARARATGPLEIQQSSSRPSAAAASLPKNLCEGSTTQKEAWGRVIFGSKARRTHTFRLEVASSCPKWRRKWGNSSQME